MGEVLMGLRSSSLEVLKVLRVLVVPIVSAASAVIGSASQAPQEPSLEFGKVAVVHSGVLNEDRRLNVFLPAGYDAATQKYPVIYLLDGSAHEDYLHATGLFDFLATYGVMPATIVVGISNVDRRRDFTMPSSDPADLKAAPTSGGAAKFVAFLEQELIPYVEAHYRVSDTRTLIGQSLAGLLATQVLLEMPQLFNDYIIVSASLWWNKQALVQSAAECLKKNRAPGRRVYISVADEPTEMKTAAERLVKLMKDLRPDITCFYEYLPAETHATSLHISLYNAMHLMNRKPER
jgi:predicted alpha/beta superfamily hydrolase